MLNFIDPKIKKKVLLAFYDYIIEVQALLMLKMVLQYEFGQLVFKWFTFSSKPYPPLSVHSGDKSHEKPKKFFLINSQKKLTKIN